MEIITANLAKIDDTLSSIEELLANARPVSFTNKEKVSIDRNRVYDLLDKLKPCLDEIEKNLPSEMIRANRVLADNDKIIDDARGKATMILRSAEVEREKMLSEHEVNRIANAQADAIVEDARKYAKELRINAVEYADEILVKTEEAVRNAQANFNKSLNTIETSFRDTIDLIYENRQELRGADQKR